MRCLERVRSALGPAARLFVAVDAPKLQAIIFDELGARAFITPGTLSVASSTWEVACGKWRWRPTHLPTYQPAYLPPTYHLTYPGVGVDPTNEFRDDSYGKVTTGGKGGNGRRAKRYTYMRARKGPIAPRHHASKYVVANR